MEKLVTAMRGSGERWKLDELIDFEVALAAWDGTSRADGLPDSPSRSTVFKAWEDKRDSPGPGRSWVGSLGWAGRILSWIALLAGIGAAWGCLDRRLEGVHVVIFLTVTLFIPWLVLVAGISAWLFRPDKAGLAGALLKKLAVRISGKKGRVVLERIEGNPELVKALGWRIAAKTQGAAADFHVGAVIGLWAMIFFRKVGFFWESTTHLAMERSLETLVRVLSFPWSWRFPQFLPSIEDTRRTNDWEGGGSGWVMFLILSLVLWGILPRVLLSWFAKARERRILDSPEFQSPGHRKLWRVLTGVRRGRDPEGPADGALVIDLGGISPDHDALRPFFLHHLRMNPVAWETLDVLDAGREAAANAALGKAPAGVILVAEGWSLAPRRMEETLKRVLDATGGRRIVIHVANFDQDGKPRAVTGDERAAWEAFIDAQKGSEVNLSLHEESAA